MNYFSELLESYDKLKKRKLSVKLDELTAAGARPVGDYTTLRQQNPEAADRVDTTLEQQLGTSDPNGPMSIGSGIPRAPKPDDPESGYGVPEGTIALVVKTIQNPVVAAPPAEAGGVVPQLPQAPVNPGQGETFVWFQGSSKNVRSMRPLINKDGNGNSQVFKQYRNALARTEAGATPQKPSTDKPKTPEEKAEAERNEANAKKRDELDRNASWDRAGGTFERHRGFRDDGPDGLEDKIRGWAISAKKLAADYRARNPEGEDHWATGGARAAKETQAEQAYVTGNGGASLERKLALAEGIEMQTEAVLDDKGKDTGETELIVTPVVLAESDIVLMRGAAESVNFLFRAALGGDEEAAFAECGKMSTYVKKSGNNFVFLGRGETEQGMVIQSNPMLEYAASRAIDNCDGQPIQQVPKSKYDPQELNDFRGKINEVALTSLHIAGLIERIKDPKIKEKVLKDHLDYIASKLLEDDYKFKAAMQWARKVASGEISTDTESQRIYETLQGLEDMTENESLLKEYFVSLARLELPVLESLSPDLILPVGVKTGQGYADDNVYGYLDEGKVKEKVEHFRKKCLAKGNVDCDHLSLGYETTTIGDLRKQGSEAKNILSHYEAAYKAEGISVSDNTPVYTVGSSLKSYLKFGGYKAGENNSWDDRSAVVRGDSQNSGNIHPQMHDQTKYNLGLDRVDGNGKPIKGSPTYAGVQEYQAKLDSEVAAIGAVFPSKDAIQVSKTGKVLDRAWSDTGAKKVYETLRNKFGYLEGQQAEILRLFKDDKNQFLPMTPENHEYIKERMTRLITTSKYHTDGNERGGDGKLTENAINARANAAYTIQMLGGAVGGGFTNVKDLDTGTTLVVSHQAPIDGPTKGILENPDDWEFKGSGSSLKITRKGTKQSISLKTTRKTRSNSYQTGSAVMISKALAEEYSMINEQVIAQNKSEEGQESIMYKFIMGQKLLLEQLEQEITEN